MDSDHWSIFPIQILFDNKFNQNFSRIKTQLHFDVNAGPQKFRNQLIYSYMKRIKLKPSSCHVIAPCRVCDVPSVFEQKLVPGRGLNHPHWTLRPRHRGTEHTFQLGGEEDREQGVGHAGLRVSHWGLLLLLRVPPAELGEIRPSHRYHGPFLKHRAEASQKYCFITSSWSECSAGGWTGL